MAQILPLANVSSDLSTNVLKLEEVRILKLKYDLPSCQFLGIIEFIGQFIVRGDAEKVFMD